MDEIEQERLRQGIAALRSDEFEQARGALRIPLLSGYRYCCLGVLTEVAVRNGLQLEAGLCCCGTKFDDEHADELVELDENLTREDVCREVADVWDFSTGILSKPVMDWYGFKSPDPAVNDQAMCASIANDDHGWNFEQIADAFEATYLTPEPETDARTAD